MYVSQGPQFWSPNINHQLVFKHFVIMIAFMPSMCILYAFLLKVLYFSYNITSILINIKRVFIEISLVYWLLQKYTFFLLCWLFEEIGVGVAVGSRESAVGGVGETCDIWNRNRKLELQFMLIACCTFSVPLNSAEFGWVEFVSFRLVSNRPRIPFSWLQISYHLA